MAKFIAGVKNAGMMIVAFLVMPYLLFITARDLLKIGKEIEELEAEIARLSGQA